MTAFAILIQDLFENIPENMNVISASYDILQIIEVQISIIY